MNFLTVLPLAVVMVAGTQLVVAVFLASSDRPRAASLGFLAGAGLLVTAGVTVSWLLTRWVGGLAADASAVAGSVDRGPAIDLVVLALLVGLAVLVWVRRDRSGPPRWLGGIEHADPRTALRLGALLFVLTPTDDLTMAAVGASVARHNLPWWHLVPFVLLTVLLRPAAAGVAVARGPGGADPDPDAGVGRGARLDRQRDRARVLRAADRVGPDPLGVSPGRHVRGNGAEMRATAVHVRLTVTPCSLSSPR
ncbi:GAP family protein [Micromonospora sp. NPDC049230]|uniref:GAP family protein n=1 Tax=Micromonospora sp. NPDC049230 TaxID=3155502 RepID=UPI0033FEA00D